AAVPAALVPASGKARRLALPFLLAGLSPVRYSPVIEPHGLFDFLQGISRHVPGLFRALVDDGFYQWQVVFILPRTFADRCQLGHHCVHHGLLALQTADASTATALLHPFMGLGVRIDFMQLPHWTQI